MGPGTGAVPGPSLQAVLFITALPWGRGYSLHHTSIHVHGTHPSIHAHGTHPSPHAHGAQTSMQVHSAHHSSFSADVSDTLYNLCSCACCCCLLRHPTHTAVLNR